MESATQTLHRLTSYTTFEPGHGGEPPVRDPRVLMRLKTNDLSRVPWYYKRYPDPLPRLALPRSLPPTSAPAVTVLAGVADVPAAELDLAQLSRLLHLSAGVVRTQPRSYGDHLFRAAGSAGARFPLELYVAVPMGLRVPAGVHWYHPQEHALYRIGPPPRDGVPTLIVTGVPWRTGWRYRERGYRHVYWDAGTMLAQTLALADSAGFPAHLYTLFPDEAVATLTGVDRVHEFPVAVVALGDGPPALTAAKPATAGAVDADPVEFPIVTPAQRAGERDVLGVAWDRGDPVALPITESAPLEAVVLARGSQRRMDASQGLSADVLHTCLGAALRGVSLPHRVVVHDAGVTPGIYRWPDLSAPARPGDFRGELYRICMHQGLPRDAAFVVIGATGVATLDDRQYREAHLAAGLAEGRLHLLAYALGASASGMTFVDAWIAGLLGEPLDALLFTCVGVPEYTSATGGLPGAPTATRYVSPRMDDQNHRPAGDRA